MKQIVIIGIIIVAFFTFFGRTYAVPTNDANFQNVSGTLRDGSINGIPISVGGIQTVVSASTVNSATKIIGTAATAPIQILNKVVGSVFPPNTLVGKASQNVSNFFKKLWS